MNDYTDVDEKSVELYVKAPTTVKYILYSILKANNRLHYNIWMNQCHNEHWLEEWSMMNDLDVAWMKDDMNHLGYYVNQPIYNDYTPLLWRRSIGFIVFTTTEHNEEVEYWVHE